MRLPNGFGSVIKLSGKRRRPYMVRKTIGWHYDPDKDKQVQDYIIIGYAETKTDGLNMLAAYSDTPLNYQVAKITFAEVYTMWSNERFPSLSKQSIANYRISFNRFSSLYDQKFNSITLDDLQDAINKHGKTQSSAGKMKNLLSQIYQYALKHDIYHKNLASFIDISQFKDINPNERFKGRFYTNDLKRIWMHKDDQKWQIVLMLIYSGVRISELLNLKKANVDIDKQVFFINRSKTSNGIRIVPIADCVLPFYKMRLASKSDYLICDDNLQPIDYRKYLYNDFRPLMDSLGFEHTPHSCRRTCVSLLAEAGVSQTIIKKIVGHSGAMTLTEKVYTHFDDSLLIDAVNKMWRP